jgi:hypothetical protein
VNTGKTQTKLKKLTFGKLTAFATTTHHRSTYYFYPSPKVLFFSNPIYKITIRRNYIAFLSTATFRRHKQFSASFSLPKSGGERRKHRVCNEKNGTKLHAGATHSSLLFSSLPVRLLLVGALEALLRQDEGHDQAVQTQGLGENENQNHAHKQLLLLAHCAHAGVAHNSDSHAGRETTRKKEGKINKNPVLTTSPKLLCTYLRPQHNPADK